MRLSVQDAAELLMVSTKTIYRWVGDGRLPGYRVNKAFRFDHAELLEWAMANRIAIAPKFLHEQEPEVIPDFDKALEAGGIAYRVGGTDRDSVLRAALDTLRLGEDADRDFLLEALVAREQLAATSIGDGIALPHLRNPLRLQLKRPSVSLCFLERPTSWGALDRKPVSILFVTLASTVRSVIQLHSRTYFALRDPAFLDVVRRQESRDVIFAEARRVAATFPPPPDPVVAARATTEDP
jgi:PTS system nitrogen regulatory IIA component